jgi:hypothetical protein
VGTQPFPAAAGYVSDFYASNEESLDPASPLCGQQFPRRKWVLAFLKPIMSSTHEILLKLYLKKVPDKFW